MNGGIARMNGGIARMNGGNEFYNLALQAGLGHT
jgi:hypothetical protein